MIKEMYSEYTLYCDLVRDMIAYVLYGSKNVFIKDKIGKKLQQVDELVYLGRMFIKDG